MECSLVEQVNSAIDIQMLQFVCLVLPFTRLAITLTEHWNFTQKEGSGCVCFCIHYHGLLCIALFLIEEALISCFHSSK